MRRAASCTSTDDCGVMVLPRRSRPGVGVAAADVGYGVDCGAMVRGEVESTFDEVDDKDGDGVGFGVEIGARDGADGGGPAPLPRFWITSGLMGSLG